MSDLISRQAAIETVKKHYRGFVNDLLEVIAYEMERLPSATDTNVGGKMNDLISRHKKRRGGDYEIQNTKERTPYMLLLRV